MTEPTATTRWSWRYGIHPRAAGTEVRSLGRVELPLGEALRLEMVDADGDMDADSRVVEMVHVQYYISTEMGDWALWISCPRSDLAAHEAALWELTEPAIDMISARPRQVPRSPVWAWAAGLRRTQR